MRFVHGCEAQILEALKSANPEIHREAVEAAGAWSIDDAWGHVVELVKAKNTEKELLLAAISAVGAIRPEEAPDALEHLMDSEDPDVEETVLEALEGEEDDEFDDELDDDEDDFDLFD